MYAKKWVDSLRYNIFAYKTIKVQIFLTNSVLIKYLVAIPSKKNI